MKSNHIFLLVFVFILYGCSYLNFDNEFNLLLADAKDEETPETLYSLDISPEKALNLHYRNLLKNGRNITDELLTKAKSTVQTNYCLCPLNFLLTEGDVAIVLLNDVYDGKLWQEIKKITPKKMIKEYDAPGVWYWLRENEQNRTRAIKLIKEFIKNQNAGIK